MKRSILLAVFGVTTLLISTAQATDEVTDQMAALPNAPIAVAPAHSHPHNFGFFDEGRPPTQVNARIWRSGRPTRQSLTALYQKGVRAIINLEDDMESSRAEATMASLMGFTVYSYPTDSFFSPDDARINEILTILRTSKYPVLVHCLHGEDRTGLVIGLERVLIEKWSAEKAYGEMLDYGFHEFFLGLVQYFDEKTGSWF